mmetsp:Transcript_38337/g.33884  ORF Transcript_38337/g.33884 Transcript_38337/m.33884 type:complete len:552 (-) Transcript_38337:191-1846(-)
MNTITLIIISFIFIINSAKYSVPFHIKHVQSGECLDWWIDPNIKVGRTPCTDALDNQWIYHPETGAVTSAFDRPHTNGNCLYAWSGNINGAALKIEKGDSDCVNWAPSQWIFKSDGHIQSKERSRVIDMHNGIEARIYNSGDWKSTQEFQVPAGAFRAVEADQHCAISKLDKVAEPKEEDEIAETAWAIGSTVAGMLPVIGGPISILTSFWDPTESDDDGPSAIELVNDVRDEMNDAFDELKKCIGDLNTVRDLKNAEEDALHTIDQVTGRLHDMKGASGGALNMQISGLFDDFDGWIHFLFEEKRDYQYYSNLLPIYSQLASLWNVVSRQKLLIDSSKNDCWNFNHHLDVTYARFNVMHYWIKEYAIKTIMDESIQIISDGNGYIEWKANELKILENKYLAHVENYIESLEDISPNLAMDKSQCTPAPPPNGDITHNFPSPSADNIITVYKYTKNAEWTLSAYQSSQTKSSILTTSRGYTKDIGVIFTLYDEEKDNTLPLYKKYNAESNKYEITTNKDDGNDNDFELVSILGYCSTFQIDPPVSSCGSFS